MLSLVGCGIAEEFLTLQLSNHLELFRKSQNVLMNSCENKDYCYGNDCRFMLVQKWICRKYLLFYADKSLAIAS